MHLAIRSDASGPQTFDPSVVTLILESTIYSEYFQVALVGFVLYDIITTVDKEARYFWKTPRSITSIVYFLNRYLGLLGVISHLYWGTFNADHTSCNYSGWIVGVSDVITRISIDYILVLRVLALYYNNTSRLTVTLKVLFVLEETFRVVSMFYSVAQEHIHVLQLSENVALCSGSALSLDVLIIIWVIPLAYELLIMALAMYKAAKFWRASEGFTGLTLVKVIALDQVITFSLVVFCSLFNMLPFTIRGSNILTTAILNFLGSTYFLCILTSHLLFNLKEAGEQGLNEGTTYRVTQPSEMVFS